MILAVLLTVSFFYTAINVEIVEPLPIIYEVEDVK